MFDGKKILITGGTGSLGMALTKRLLNYNVDTIRIFSRNENKQITMQSELNDQRLRFFIGDVRDFDRLKRAFEDIDIVFHAAALKHVPFIEYNPFEAIKTNVAGSEMIIEACLHENVEIVVAISTDKAVSPLNTYGATKLLMEKLFVTAQNYLEPKRHPTKFITLRYGNVLGSSGSVIPKFISQIKAGEPLTITDSSMTRFSITMDEALDFIFESVQIGNGSEIFIPKLRAYTIDDLKNALHELLGNTGDKKIPIRQGEKLHETLINVDELRYTYETDSKYVIVNQELSESELKRKYPNFKKTSLKDHYSSDTVEKISKDELKEILSKSSLLKE